MKWSEGHSIMSDFLWPHGLYSPWNSPGQNTGEGSLSLLQGIFPAQGWNPGLPHCRWILYQLNHKGSPGILGALQLSLNSSTAVTTPLFCPPWDCLWSVSKVRFLTPRCVLVKGTVLSLAWSPGPAVFHSVCLGSQSSGCWIHLSLPSELNAFILERVVE